MANLLMNSRYTEQEQKEIMSVFLTPNTQQYPKYISTVSDDLLKQISFNIQLCYFFHGVKGESGSSFRERGKDIKKTAKRLKRCLKGPNKGVFNSVDIILAETMKMPRFNELNEYHNNKEAFVIEWFLEVLTLIEVTGHDIEHRSLVTKGKDYTLERELINSIAIVWSRVTKKRPTFRRDTHFQKLVAKIFELEKLGAVSERTIKSALSMYIQKP